MKGSGDSLVVRPLWRRHCVQFPNTAHFQMFGNINVEIIWSKLPKQNDIQLETTQVTLADIVQLPFYSEYQWLLDFAVYAIFVYIITEVYISFFPTKSAQELNLSMVWCALAVGFAYKILTSLTSLYFKSEEAGERSLVISMGFVYLLFSMLSMFYRQQNCLCVLYECKSLHTNSNTQFMEFS